MLNLQERSPETIQNPGADTKILFNDATDGLLKTKDSSGVVETLATTEGIADTEPKVYVALLTQTGTDAPVATILKNTLGGVPVWSYVTVGDYNCTLAGVFELQKTTTIITNNIDETRVHTRVIKIDEDIIGVRTGEYSFTAPDTFVFEPLDGYLSATTIKIEVYP